MRCLYCGKELALLKRWTGGGEFCSDSHRQRYQEEYNQLALNRLLQAKPSEAAIPASAPADSKQKGSSWPAAKTAVAPPRPPAKPEPKPKPIASFAAAPEEHPAPAETGFLIEMPLPVLAGAVTAAVIQTDFDRRPSPALPSLNRDSWATGFASAGQILLQSFFRAADHPENRACNGIELREFVRTAPVVEFDLRPAAKAGIAEPSEEPMDITFFPQPPQPSPPLWSEGEKNFAFHTELGSLARMVLRTTGIDGNESGDAPLPVSDPVNEAPAEPGERAPSMTAAEPPAPVRMPEPPVVRPLSKPGVQVAPVPQAIPLAATTPLPVTLHGVAAGRGKLVQVFPSAVSGGVDLQVPRSNALPLRPVMILAPAKETDEVKPEVKQELKKTQRHDPRLNNGKGRRPESEKTEPGKKAVTEAVKEPEPVKPSTVYNPPGLELPSLTLSTSGTFWSRLPVAGKAAFGLAVALAIGGAIFAMTRGGNAPTAGAAAQVVEAGPALNALDSGWITDWGAEPGIRREHNISVLRPSLSLTDYRIEFEAQIDTKALGWIYRATDGKNYYVNKLEIVKPGLAPTVALVRFAVINGEEQARAQSPLNIPLHLDTLYKVRFDAIGDRFTTYVQDQKVDEWTDDRLKAGGIGLYNERGERMSLKGAVNVVPLVIRKQR